jgi:hypothetical protein
MNAFLSSVNFSAGSGNPEQSPDRPLKNVFEAADARQKQAKKRSLCIINEHFEPVFNTVAATQIVFQRPTKNAPNYIPTHHRSVAVSDKHLSIAIGNRLQYLWFAIHKNAKSFPRAGAIGVFSQGNLRLRSG